MKININYLDIPIFAVSIYTANALFVTMKNKHSTYVFILVSAADSKLLYDSFYACYKFVITYEF